MATMVQPLKWDSRFFSLQIGKITAAQYPVSFDAADIQSYDLIYIQQDEIADFPRNLLKSFNVLYTDKKWVYHKNIYTALFPDKNIEEYTLKTANTTLVNLALQSGQYSRFRLDSNFNPAAYKRLYKKWIQNSVEKKSADVTLIYGNIRKPLGFITLAFSGPDAHLGLLAVDEQQQNKGIGSALIHAAEYYALHNNCTTLGVTTQAANRNACKFYEKAGFSKKNVVYTHHHWKKE